VSISGREGLARRHIAAVTRIAVKMLILPGGKPSAWMILTVVLMMWNTWRQRCSWCGTICPSTNKSLLASAEDERNALCWHRLDAFDGFCQEFRYALASIIKLIQDPLKLVLLAFNPSGRE
jgi:hypothetical protein